MHFLRQLFVDQYSLFMYGPSQFLTKDIGAAGSSIADFLGSFGPRKTNFNEKAAKDDPNSVF